MATLINVATPGPALAAVKGTESAASGYSYFVGNLVNMATSSTPYNINSLSLTAGTWVVVGLVGTNSATGTLTLFLSGTTASATNLAPVQTVGTGQGTSVPAMMITSVIKVAVTTTVYLNAEDTAIATGQGAILATQIA